MAYIKFKPITSRMNFKTQVALEEIPEEAKYILNPTERILYVFKAYRDYSIFTTERIILINYKGIRGLRKDFITIIFGSISTVILTVKNFESVFKVITSDGYTINFNFLKNNIPLSTVYEIYHFTLNRTIKNTNVIPQPINQQQKGL